MDNESSATTPWHLWVVGVVSLIWNGLGAKNYLDVKEGAEAFRAQQAEAFGTSPEIVSAYFDNYPLWADILYGFSVWGAVAGAILLLLRSRFAVAGFWLALAGFVGGVIHGVVDPIEGAQNVGFMWTVAIVSGIAIALQLYYASRMRNAGVLR